MGIIYMKKTIGFNGKRLLYLFVGLLFSLSVAAMVCTRSFNLNDFFDEGKRTEVDPGGVDGFNVELATYGALQWSCWWISEDAYVEIKAPGDETAYSILALDIISMKDVTTVEFECLNSEGETVGMVEAKLQPGKNIVNLEQYMSADIIRIYNGESIAFKSVWFWEKEREKVDISFAVGFLYLLQSGCFWVNFSNV